MKNQVKFKVGDLVYYAECKKICKIVGVFCTNIVLDIGKIRVCIPIMNFFGMPAPIFHAAQENYELLSKLYPNVEFEPPPKHKEPREIIEAMLESGWYRVPVVADGCLHFVNSTINHISRNWQRFYPFDPKTGKTIIDFVDGKCVLENGEVVE